MLLTWKVMLLVVAAVAPMAISAFTPRGAPEWTASRVPVPDVVELRPGVFRYRAGGDFTRDGKPARAPIVAVTVMRPFAVMKHQVTAADYRRCVEAGACPLVDRDEVASDRPAVKISWRDAHAYASWLSHATGANFRLPTDAEWAYAAASRFKDDVLPESAYGSDPGRRALTIYDRDASREEVIDKAPQTIGSFGANENGLLDVAGNVWEWTDTCFARVMLDARGEAVATLANCGVRIAAGRHRSYVPDFIRDTRGGGCSAGAQPGNLGFRLVRDDAARRPLRLLLAKAGP